MKRTELWTIIAAAGILAAQPAAFAAPVRGRVTAVDSTAKTITLSQGRQQAATAATLHVNDATKYAVPAQGSISDIKVGDTIRVMGQTTGNTIAARNITEVPAAAPGHAAPGGQARRGGRMGAQGVVATTTPTLTITTADNQTDTITTDASTQVSTTKPGTLDDVKVGAFVTAQTTGEGDSAVATSVDVMAMGQRGQGRRGGRRGNNQQGQPAPEAPPAPAAQ